MRALCALLLFSAASISVSAALAVVQPLIAQFDGGPSIPSGYAFGAGESLFVTFDVAGFKAEGDEDKRLHITWQCTAVDSAGVPFALPQSGEVKAGLADEDKNWKPRVRFEVALPQGLPSGGAELRIAVKDVLGKTEATLAVPFRTRGLRIDQVDKLQPLQFRFLRTEEANEPLVVAAYRPGDTVWARFEMAGYKMGEGNEFHTSYGIEVLRASGETLYKQEEAANEQAKSLYPRRYVPGALSLQLTRDLAPGEYTIILRLRDHIGNQNSETRHKFRVE